MMVKFVSDGSKDKRRSINIILIMAEENLFALYVALLHDQLRQRDNDRYVKSSFRPHNGN